MRVVLLFDFLGFRRLSCRFFRRVRLLAQFHQSTPIPAPGGVHLSIDQGGSIVRIQGNGLFKYRRRFAEAFFPRIGRKARAIALHQLKIRGGAVADADALIERRQRRARRRA